ncbi:uncharacterized protein LOC111153507 [Enhydra lutris kenyoni]|uniref:Uncharacterized protein LOC111153507 n=1 Tax=Enhydra lutris kenyoni TaxID=391180 RepID=A0A2Y9KFU3_ENHLU|nr:uncharacterized protein LOC111153507 [Enhydra lutris kenyoni]
MWTQRQACEDTGRRQPCASQGDSGRLRAFARTLEDTDPAKPPVSRFHLQKGQRIGFSWLSRPLCCLVPRPGQNATRHKQLLAVKRGTPMYKTLRWGTGRLGHSGPLESWGSPGSVLLGPPRAALWTPQFSSSQAGPGSPSGNNGQAAVKRGARPWGAQALNRLPITAAVLWRPEAVTRPCGAQHGDTDSATQGQGRQGTLERTWCSGGRESWGPCHRRPHTFTLYREGRLQEARARGHRAHPQTRTRVSRPRSHRSAPRAGLSLCPARRGSRGGVFAPQGLVTAASGSNLGLSRHGPTAGPARRRVILVEREHPALPSAWTLPSAVALLAGTSRNSPPRWGRGPVVPGRGRTVSVLCAPQNRGGALALGHGEPPGRAGPKTVGDKQEGLRSLQDLQEEEQKEAQGSEPPTGSFRWKVPGQKTASPISSDGERVSHSPGAKASALPAVVCQVFQELVHSHCSATSYQAVTTGLGLKCRVSNLERRNDFLPGPSGVSQLGPDLCP